MLYRNDGDDRMVVERHWDWRQYLSRRTSALVRHVQSVVDGESSTIEVNLCSCNGGGGRLDTLYLEPARNGAVVATATVAFHNSPSVIVKLYLIRENGWKIDDVVDPGGRRLTTIARQEITAAEKH